ncbi:hypothetical protein JCM9279_000491 [Rhodotorula babjevae]
MLAPLAALAALLSLSVAAQDAPAYLDPLAFSRLLSSSENRHRAALDAYRINVESRPQTIELARKARVLAAGLERAHGLGRLRERSEVALERRQQGTGTRGVVELFDFFSQPLDVMIYGAVEVGTPAQSFDLLFDTGSADMWVYADGTGSREPEWDASASSTAVTSPALPWSIRYGRGEQTGFLNQDTVSLGGYEVNNTIFAAANTLNEAFTYYPISGLFGLGFGTISASGYAPWFERLISSGELAEQYFSLYLVRASDVTTEAEGSLPGAQMCIGCVDSSKYTGEINWLPVQSEGFWAVDMDGIEINGTVVEGTAVRAAIDSGTTLIQVPPAVAQAFYAEIPGSIPSTTIEGSYIIPCSTPFSSLALVFGGVRYEIPRRDLLRAISSDGRQCVLTIAESQSEDVDGTPMAIVGDVFLKNAYSIYSYSHQGAPGVGFARSVIAGSYSNSSTGSSSTGSGSFTEPANVGTLSVSGAPVPTVSSRASRGSTALGTGTLGAGTSTSIGPMASGSTGTGQNAQSAGGRTTVALGVSLLAAFLASSFLA